MNSGLQAIQQCAAKRFFAACALLCLSVLPAAAQYRPGPAPHPPYAHPATGDHLREWVENHRGLTPDQQELALRREPGFAHLPPEQQQRILERLHRFNMQPPAERERLNAWNERFMALPPQRQQEIRAASQALSQMPPERRQALRNAFHDLRSLPPEQRHEALESARFRAEYSPQERSILGSLLSIEPYPSGPR